jgi:hypothetical protein
LIYKISLDNKLKKCIIVSLEECMKKMFIILFFVSGLIYGQVKNNISDNGIIALSDKNYSFMITLVNDLNKTIEIWDTAEQMPGLTAITKVKRNSTISLFLIFGTHNNENVNLTYSVRIKDPNGKFSSNDYKDLIIARTNITKNIFFRGRQLLTIMFDNTDEYGKYQFHITIKDGRKIIHNCIMEFELIE